MPVYAYPVIYGAAGRAMHQGKLSANVEILIFVQASISIKGFKLPSQHVVTLSRVGLAYARLCLKDTTKDETRYKINKCTIVTYRSQD